MAVKLDKGFNNEMDFSFRILQGKIAISKKEILSKWLRCL
ncbi:Hypothetical protein BN2458_PEG0321 [Helicobacter typhlonius]|uniref:Uncharacterized protein n=1 Tax=Helicobacter typhlonius TaxID=76936 RepID=A0A0S4PSC2_9HELI|nr:Hypothetical protein BN2458_PEG0321 [Helicobacter typhlonius]